MSNLAINDAGDVLMFDGQQWKPAPIAVNDKGDRVVYDGQSWKPHGELVGTAKGTADAGKSTSDAVAQAVGSGALMNMGDEATAAVRAAAPGFANWMMRGPNLQRAPEIGGSPEPQTVSTAPTYQGRYDEELARERAKTAQFQKTNPVLATGANIAGGAASAALTLPMLPAGLTAIGPSALSNMARVGLVGAGYGGAAGFGEGEGTEDRLKKAGIGAAAGGVLGAASRPAAAIGNSILESGLVRPVADRAQRLAEILQRGATPAASAVSPTAEEGAAGRIATTFQRDRLTPEIAQQRLTALGAEAIPSDISESLLQQGVNMKTLGGETRQRAKDLFDPFLPQPGQEGRSARAGTRMIGAAEGENPPQSHFALTGEGQAYDQNVRKVGAQAYGKMGADKLHISAEMQDIAREAPDIGKTLKGIQEQYAGLGEKLTPIELMDKVKQQLNLNATAAFASGTGVDKAAVGKLADRFEAAFWKANPGAQEAAGAYAQAKSLPGHYAAGGSIFTKGTGEKATAGSAPALEDLLMGADAQQVAAQRAGAINTIRARAGTRGGTLTMAQDIKTGINPGGVQDALRTVMPDEAQNVINRAAGERIFANTENRYLGGPNTANDLVGATGFGDNLSVRGTPGGGIIPRFQESARAAANWVAEPNEAVRNQIGRMLLESRPEEQQRILAMIAQILQQRAAGSPVAAGVAGATGAQVGRAF